MPQWSMIGHIITRGPLPKLITSACRIWSFHRLHQEICDEHVHVQLQDDRIIIFGRGEEMPLEMCLFIY
jgi:hypothetical protein